MKIEYEQSLTIRDMPTDAVMHCPKCGFSGDPTLCYRRDRQSCSSWGEHPYTEHLDVLCRRCGFDTWIPVR